MPAPPASLPTGIPGDPSAAVSTDGSVLQSETATSTSPKLQAWSVEGALKSFSLPPPASTAPTTPIPFLHLLERLKTTPREGWRRFSITPGESISDHMYRMALITLVCPPTLASQLDLPRCTKMALVHDMGEALVGDITPVDGVSKLEKSRRETLSMDYLLGRMLGSTVAGPSGTGASVELRQIWEEYEDSKTLESKFVHDVDKLELVLQMVEYEKRYEGKIDLGEFAWVAGRIELREMKEWAAELLEEREAFWKDRENGKTVESIGVAAQLREALSKGLDAVKGAQNGTVNSG